MDRQFSIKAKATWEKLGRINLSPMRNAAVSQRAISKKMERMGMPWSLRTCEILLPLAFLSSAHPLVEAGIEEIFLCQLPLSILHLIIDFCVFYR